MTVRAFYRAASIEGAQPPHNTLTLKVYYPALDRQGRNPNEMVPADAAQAPFPVAIFLPGFHCHLEAYQWLLVRLVERGFVGIAYHWLAPAGLTPGIDAARWMPDAYGTAPTALALPTLLDELERLQADSILAGLLDLQTVVLGGHSAGGRLALENATPQFFPQVRAAFAYAAHTGVPTAFGYAPATVLPVSGAVPILMLNGTQDGIIARASSQYGLAEPDPLAMARRTFWHGIQYGNGDKYWGLLDGGNHFVLTDPADATLGTLSLDWPATQSPQRLRDAAGRAIGAFLDAHLRARAGSPAALQQALDASQAPIAALEQR